MDEAPETPASDTPALDPHTLRELTAEVVAAYVAHNAVQPSQLPGLIGDVHAALAGLGRPVVVAEAAPLVPAVPIKKSVTDEYIISLEDGRRFKSLKRYLATSHNMTPAEYRARWSLPPDYPMVAPAYAKKRSSLAKNMGLGQQRRTFPDKATPAAQPAAH